MTIGARTPPENEAMTIGARTPPPNERESAAPDGAPRPAREANQAAAAAPAPAPAAEVGAGAQRRRPRPFSSLTGRILAVNVLALAILVAGLLYLNQYEDSLVAAEVEALETQGEIFAAALGEGAVAIPPTGRPMLLPGLARQMMRRLVAPTRTRARLFSEDGYLIADSWILAGPGGLVEREHLSPPGGGFGALVGEVYDRIVGWLPQRRDLPLYHERMGQRAIDYAEVQRALQGDGGHAIRAAGQGGKILSVAVPVQQYKQVVGALMLSTSSAEIEKAVREVRLDILKVFLFALAVTVLLSVYLSGTITRPVRWLAVAADEVTHGHGRKAAIPDFTRRRDEIGDLSGALREMTAALWSRMDAIEGFAADVAHEIKNPLTSLRSAVETAARVKDPGRQKRLMAIILEDVQRLDRLISDISDASRLDAELSRAELEPVDVAGLLTALANLYRGRAREDGPRIELDLSADGDLHVSGMEGRLSQVFRNLIDNAVSFSPAGGVISLRAARAGGFVTVIVDDEGPGIPEGKLEGVFERFYSERPTGEKFGTHSGLGLSISRQIVEAHGGTLTAENRRDKAGAVHGARFIVRLPAH